uniref:uncharacterized protein LOC122584785 n=1 Tax=Erigeron canadensis TaxID=72917 RepID=UPI001CB8C7CD|nr:uncharacterized protein LOC122584785 [Erigeron canadensis]
MGDYPQQYGMLKDYILELKACNPDITVKLNFEPNHDLNSDTRQFRRVYVCLGPLKVGFKAGKRDLLGLDGSFMKSPATRILLIAVGVDPNHQTYPLAYGIVESENRASWTWFLECLGEDLNLDHMSNFTFISDRQQGQVYQDFLWKAVNSPTVAEFNKVMEDLKKVKQEAYNWLKEIPPRHWSKSVFRGQVYKDLLFNLCFIMFSIYSGHMQLVDGREKPIILCLEFIREYNMKRLAKVQKDIDQSAGPLTPRATEMFEAIKTEATKYRATFNGHTTFEVVGPWMDQHVVDLELRTCSCRRWELTGMPCKHVMASIFDVADNEGTIGSPESYVNPEDRISRAGAKLKCVNCKLDGHNKRTCPKKNTTSEAGGSKGCGKKTATSQAGGGKKTTSSQAGGGKKSANSSSQAVGSQAT